MKDRLREIAERQRKLTGDIRRLQPPQSRKPDKWHEEKSDLCARAIEIARDIEALITVPRQSSTARG